MPTMAAISLIPPSNPGDSLWRWIARSWDRVSFFVAAFCGPRFVTEKKVVTRGRLLLRFFEATAGPEAPIGRTREHRWRWLPGPSPLPCNRYWGPVTDNRRPLDVPRYRNRGFREGRYGNPWTKGSCEEPRLRLMVYTASDTKLVYLPPFLSSWCLFSFYHWSIIPV